MSELVNNPEVRCLNCPNMVCRQFTVKTETWNGYCLVCHKEVNGDGFCYLPRQPTLFKWE